MAAAIAEYPARLRSIVMARVSEAAYFAIIALRDEPSCDTPSRIANGPFSIEQIDAADVSDGLQELRERGMAVEIRGRWALTDAGRAHHQ